MAVMTGPTKGAAELLNGLLELEYDALSAYDTALAHLAEERDRRQIDAFLTTHHRHVAELSQLVVDRREEPVVRGDFRRLLEKGKVALGAIAGEQAVIVAMKSNADDLATAYQRAITDTSLNDRERSVIERCLADQHWHSAWLENRLGLTPDVGEAIMAEEGENIRALRDSRTSRPSQPSRADRRGSRASFS
jgi:bacterioferritin (cytochrome b1)